MPSGEPIPEGIYKLRCDKVTYKLSAKNSTPMAEATFTIYGPDSAEEYQGRKVFENFMLAGEGQFKTRQFLSAVGKDEDFVLEDTDDLIGLEAGAVIQIEKERTDASTGKAYAAKNKISKFIPENEVD